MCRVWDMLNINDKGYHSRRRHHNGKLSTFFFSAVFNVETCLVFVALMAHTHCMGPDRDQERNWDGHNRKQWFPVTLPVPE